MKKLILTITLLTSLAHAQSLYLCAGQSNARARGDSATSLTPALGTAFEYVHSGDSLRPLSDPFGENFGPFQQANTGSAWPSFAYHYFQCSGEIPYLVSAAKGGSHLVQSGWSFFLKRNAKDKAKAAEARTGRSLAGVIWLQGESDATALNAGQISAQQYADSLTSLISYFRREFSAGLHFYIVLTGHNLSQPDSGYNAIRNAQQSVADADSLTWIIYDSTHLFPGKGWMVDGVHYDQRGLNDIGSVAGCLVANIEASGVMHYQQDTTPATSAENSPDELTIYPNPSKGIFRLTKKCFYRVYDLSFKLIKKGKGDSLELPPGVYRIMTGRKSFIVRRF